jgi:hypothetical protein
MGLAISSAPEGVPLACAQRPLRGHGWRLGSGFPPRGAPSTDPGLWGGARSLISMEFDPNRSAQMHPRYQLTLGHSELRPTTPKR